MHQKTQIIITVLALVITWGFASSPAYGQEMEKEVVNRMATNFQDDWNRHDMNALSLLVAEDVDFITVGGGWQKGRKEFKEKHAKAHQSQFKESVLTIQRSHARAIKPDVMVAHVEWGMAGDKDPDGTPRQPRQGILTWVLQKRNGKWLIIASQNTNIRPPIPVK